MLESTKTEAVKVAFERLFRRYIEHALEIALHSR